MDYCGFSRATFHHTLEEINLQRQDAELYRKPLVWMHNNTIDYGTGGLVFELFAKEMMRATEQSLYILDSMTLFQEEQQDWLWETKHPVFVKDFYVDGGKPLGFTGEEVKRVEDWYRYRYYGKRITWVFGDLLTPGSKKQTNWYSDRFVNWLEVNATILSTGL